MPASSNLNDVLRGTALLWDSVALGQLGVQSSEVLSIRGLFSLAKSWPEELPSASGRLVVVAGVEGCLDVLSPTDGEAWLEQDLRPTLFSFQDEYQGEAGLVFWLATGKARVIRSPSYEYSWQSAPPNSESRLPIGRMLWGGAEQHARPLVVDGGAGRSVEVGLHHRRIS